MIASIFSLIGTAIGQLLSDIGFFGLIYLYFGTQGFKFGLIYIFKWLFNFNFDLISDYLNIKI